MMARGNRIELIIFGDAKYDAIRYVLSYLLIPIPYLVYIYNICALLFWGTTK